MALSVVTIKGAKARDNAYKLSDSDGLYLLLTPSGGRYWRMNYRYLGKQRTLAFGVWAETGLAEARGARSSPQGAGARRRSRRADRARTDRRVVGGGQQLHGGRQRMAAQGPRRRADRRSR